NDFPRRRVSVLGGRGAPSAPRRRRSFAGTARRKRPWPCAAGTRRPRSPAWPLPPWNISAPTWRSPLPNAALDIRLVILDWAGTTIDFGSRAPLTAFVRTFAQHGVTVTTAEARGPMGLPKRDHLRTMLQMPGVARRWREALGRDW